MRMMTGKIALAVLALGLGGAAVAGDASGFDPQTIDQCIADEGDCADVGMQACRDYAKEKYTGDDADFVEKNCLDASHQAWESKLTETYEALLELEAEVGIKPTETLRQTELSWIKFRDDLCHYEETTAKARDENAEIAELTCQRDEAARHWQLLQERRKALTK